MGRYSIKELECLSGIKAHTLRIWEKRFNLLNPERTETNIRYYSDEDLKKILNVSLLTTSGFKISEIATFSDEELAKAVIEMNNEEIRNLKRVNELIITMNELNEVKFNELYERFVSTLGFEKTITEVIYPYLEKVGILWLSGEVQAVQEHLISSLIRTKILKEIDNLPFPKNPKNSAIIFLPEGEYHELAILYFYYKLKKQGTLVYYFGQSTPVAQVAQLIDQVKADYIITYSVVKSRDEIESFLNKLDEASHGQILYIENKHQAQMGIIYPESVKKVSSFPAALDAL